MLKLVSTASLVATALSLSGCVMKQKILDAGGVSMTHQSLKDGESLKETGPVSGTFCADSLHDKGQIGLMDEAIKSAQDQGGVDYITNASFYLTGNHCVLIEGTGNKVVAMASPTEAPAHPKIKKH